MNWNKDKLDLSIMNKRAFNIHGHFKSSIQVPTTTKISNNTERLVRVGKDRIKSMQKILQKMKGLPASRRNVLDTLLIMLLGLQSSY